MNPPAPPLASPACQSPQAPKSVNELEARIAHLFRGSLAGPAVHPLWPLLRAHRGLPPLPVLMDE